MTHTTTTTARVPAWKTQPASEKQTALIAQLLDSKELSEVFETSARKALADGLTKGMASTMIEMLFDAPRKAAPVAEGAEARTPVAEEGIYERADVVYKVQKSAAGRFYAKVLVANGARRLTEMGEIVKGSFEYEAGAVNEIGAEDKVSLERAKELGHLTSICIVSGTPLEDAKSVAAGIGPVCAKKF
jgi:hypothetical protein